MLEMCSKLGFLVERHAQDSNIRQVSLKLR
jgi:hypothetical protein